MSNTIKNTAVAALICAIHGRHGVCRQGKNIPTFPPTADSRLAEGWSAFESGSYATALERFTAAKNRDASYADAYRGLGWSMRASGFHQRRDQFLKSTPPCQGRSGQGQRRQAGTGDHVRRQGQDQRPSRCASSS